MSVLFQKPSEGVGRSAGAAPNPQTESLQYQRYLNYLIGFSALPCTLIWWSVEATSDAKLKKPGQYSRRKPRWRVHPPHVEDARERVRRAAAALSDKLTSAADKASLWPSPPFGQVLYVVLPKSAASAGDGLSKLLGSVRWETGRCLAFCRLLGAAVLGTAGSAPMAVRKLETLEDDECVDIFCSLYRQSSLSPTMTVPCEIAQSMHYQQRYAVPAEAHPRGCGEAMLQDYRKQADPTTLSKDPIGIIFKDGDDSQTGYAHPAGDLQHRVKHRGMIEIVKDATTIANIQQSCRSTGRF
ncbi:phosphatidylinositol 4,5-bisphosphate 3-kinase catalytic subunit gamma isoform [Lates japonicus]|uniref:Phosphatidylinositol 4,5-bisphosphate 3-kinase catalytic subunit gamma isoform n=1 Tax=Lates japonicus TaxID=270547 RepID=A0AAD3NKB0_LATJO|nr:phosphatidylinositol 4,5-bisphosphate 3-kinase catalytic subunit gamma isoform [Lates japonicus]